MTPREISQLIQHQIAAQPGLPNPHGVDLKRCLTNPTIIKVIERNVIRGKFKERVVAVWLVLEERLKRLVRLDLARVSG